MNILLYHGYELTGSGSNEYTRYLARALAQCGHTVSILCAEPEPEQFEFIADGTVRLFRLPRTSVYPVYLTDKQRSGVVKAFPELTDAELSEYEDAMVGALSHAIAASKPDIVHCNHLVYQPVVAMRACAATGTPYYVVPHGSSIEYTIRRDRRFWERARAGLAHAAGVAWIAREVRQRVLDLFPDDADAIARKSEFVGVGTDTSLFDVVLPERHGEALAMLAGLHRPGGKTAAQRAELRAALANGDIDATRRYWDAYDHKLEDDDLPAILGRLPPDADIVFFVGAMTYGKGIQSLIAAMPAIARRRPAAHLVLVGSGTYREVLEALVFALATGNESLLSQLARVGRDLERDDTSGAWDDVVAYAEEPMRRREMLACRDLDARIHFIGRLDHERLRHVFACARVAVFPSVVKEASPLVFAEALANGVLPAGAYHSGLRDGLDDLSPHLPEDVAAHIKLPIEADRRIAGIADHVCWLLDYLDTNQLAPRLRKLAVDRYDWRAVADHLAAAASRFARATDLSTAQD